MDAVRRPFQGVANIVRFNWHFFLLAGAGAVALALASAHFTGAPRWLALLALVLLVGTTMVSLLVSCYVYDLSGLYRMEWLAGVVAVPGEPEAEMANIHAGFDETSSLLRARYSEASWTVMDFYDPAKHTEISIRRARRAYPPSSRDLRVETADLPLTSASMDAVFVVLAAHEIRDVAERRAFFQELERVLKPTGRAVVVEHLRDWRNALAYSVGVFHFISRRAWLEAFEQARLKVALTLAPNPFLTCFVLERRDQTS